MDVIWLKRDVRLIDHGPFATVSRKCGSGYHLDYKVCIVYIYEPDQLSESSVHGSHIHFVNEGLAALDVKLSSSIGNHDNNNDDDDDGGGVLNVYGRKLENITLCYGECTNVFQTLHESVGKIQHIYAHMETGHLASFERDKRVRRWCKSQSIPIVEFNQTGVTRCLKDRDDFSNLLNKFISKPMYNQPTEVHKLINSIRPHIHLPSLNTTTKEEKTDWMKDVMFYSTLKKPEEFREIPLEHQADRVCREQIGGEYKALKVLHSFLSQRAEYYGKNISSPNTSWNSCSRLSPYITWGHISLRYIIQTTKKRQIQIKQFQNKKKSPSFWGRSLVNFLSRMHWRSHFVQKLETQPNMEKLDLCTAYQGLRRQPGDWNETYYHAWATGNTGYPFVDACMRCLIQYGWINFRMRAMLVSFACWNLWLDWKRIAPHLARLFLDYEPGIHYPQLQMQAGTTGINAMRVYNVTKQGKDQDPRGTFIKKHIAQLKNVPIPYIHEPWKMSLILQEKYQIKISNRKDSPNGEESCYSYYTKPIIDEKATAKEAKDKVAAIRNMTSTKQIAKAVYIKHGSRANNRRNHQDDKVVISLFNDQSPVAKKLKLASTKTPIHQKSIRDIFTTSTCNQQQSTQNNSSKPTASKHANKPSKNIIIFNDSEVNIKETSISQVKNIKKNKSQCNKDSQSFTKTAAIQNEISPNSGNFKMNSPHQSSNRAEFVDISMECDEHHGSVKTNSGSRFWTCLVCTFQNKKLLAPVCEMCASPR